MSEMMKKSMRRGIGAAMLILHAATAASAGDKKKPADAKPEPPLTLDISHIVWPQPPAIARVRYLDYFSAEKREPVVAKPQVKKSWMDRMAGISPDDQAKKANAKPRFELGLPYGMAVDSKGMLYVADTKVGAIFIFNPESRDTTLIKHGVDAKFGRVFGLAMDDADRLFVSDGKYNHVLVFNPQHKLEGVFGEGVMDDPNGLAIDEENRFLYVANTGTDQILVYDADTFKLLRKIGTGGKKHTLTSPGDFSSPTNIAVDSDGNLIVADTLNDRIEEFDAEGAFIRAFGKNGDGPGDFTRPKGVAVDCDNHIWVADAMANRVQVFAEDGSLRLIFGGFGNLPGQFRGLTGLTIDKKNRAFTSEQFQGRVQMFRYTTNAEAQKEFDRRAEERAKQAGKPTEEKKPDDKAPAPEAPKAPVPQASKPS